MSEGQSQHLLTVVIPFHYRKEPSNPLVQAVHSWVGLNDRRVQLILVADGPETAVSWIRRLDIKSTSKCELRLVVLPQQSGPGAARNAGLADATGELIYFMDSDDVVYPSVILSIAERFSHTDYDLAAFGYEIRNATGGRSRHLPLPTGVPLVAHILRYAAIWRFLIRVSTLDRVGITFPDSRYGEDLLFLLSLAECKPKVLSFRQVGYAYHLNIESTSGIKSVRNKECQQLLDQLSRPLMVNGKSPLLLYSIKAVRTVWRWRVSRRQDQLSAGDVT